MIAIVIEVLGGVVQNVYCSDPEQNQVVVVDWDDGAEIKAGVFPIRMLTEVPCSTMSAVEKSMFRGL